MSNKKALLLFTNSPVRETFIKNVFSNKNVNESLIRAFLNNVVNSITQAQKKLGFDFIIATDKATSENLQKSNTLNQIPYNRLIPFYGNSFGDRFTKSISDVFSLGYEHIIVVGNDCPDITSSLIVKSFNQLEEGKTVVGPSTDGGFYLLGLRYFEKKFFNNIEWNTAKVFSQLIRNLSGENENAHFLQTLTDIDDQKSLTEWLKLRTGASKLINNIIIRLSTIPSLCSLVTPPFNKEVYLAKRAVQKSPPVKY